MPKYFTFLPLHATILRVKAERNVKSKQSVAEAWREPRWQRQRGLGFIHLFCVCVCVRAPHRPHLLTAFFQPEKARTRNRSARPWTCCRRWWSSVCRPSAWNPCHCWSCGRARGQTCLWTRTPSFPRTCAGRRCSSPQSESADTHAPEKKNKKTLATCQLCCGGLS